MIVLAALVMRGPINAVGPMAPVVRDVFDLPWEAFGVLAGIPTMAFGLCSLAVLPLVAGFGSRTFAVAALTGAALGSFVRCIEWMPALFLGTLILSVSIAGLNVWVPSVIKVVFHDRQSQVMGVYTAVLSISGLLGTASVMPALEAGGVWWAPFAVWGLAALAPLVWAVGFGGVPLPVPERKGRRLEKSGAPVALLVWFVAIQAGLTFTVASMMPSGLEVAGFSRPDAVNAVTFYLGAMFAGSLGCGFLPVARTIYPVVGAVYLTGLWIWMEGGRRIRRPHGSGACNGRAAGSIRDDFADRRDEEDAGSRHSASDRARAVRRLPAGRPCTHDGGRLGFGLRILKTVESTLSQIRRRRARGTSGLWPSSP